MLFRIEVPMQFICICLSLPPSRHRYPASLFCCLCLYLYFTSSTTIIILSTLIFCSDFLMLFCAHYIHIHTIYIYVSVLANWKFSCIRVLRRPVKSIQRFVLFVRFVSGGRLEYSTANL